MSIILGLILSVSCSNNDDDIALLQVKEFPDRKEDFSMWQLDSFFEEVQMGYIIRTDDGKIIVVDGGGKRTAPILEGYLKQLGNHVHTWILTHPHADHIGAFMEVVDTGNIKIDRILHAAIDLDWVRQNESDAFELVQRYMNILRDSGIPVFDVELLTKISLGKGVEMTTIGVKNEEIRMNAINNSSLVFKVTGKSKSILFTGDLGTEGGNKILNETDTPMLKADYIQMAHHGQRGVTKSFYEAVGAQYALWPTPKWLWENSIDGKKSNTGSFKTLEVRDWMNSLGIKKNYVSGLAGTVRID